MPRARAQRARRDERASLVEALRDPACWGSGVREVRLAETHISWVFLTGRYAYKVKKPVKLPFLDFSTLALRRHFCKQELTVNRRLAAPLYLGVLPLGGTAAAPRIGRTPAFEYALKMRQFPDDARLDRRLAANAIGRDDLVAFADALARFHARQPPLAPRAAADTAVTAALDNFADLERGASTRERAALRALHAWTERQGRSLAPVMGRRAASGAYRDGHGDLHLENLLDWRGKIVAFDALEFDRKLREIDVASEIAFLVMDLLAHERGDLAFTFLTRYLETSGDYDSLLVLRYYMVYRALVRAKVSIIKAAQKTAKTGRDDAGPYLALASKLAAPRRPLLLITHGLSGSGKTTVTDELIARLPAVRVRSDLERKRLQGLAATARSGSAVGGDLYSADSSARTYAALGAIADNALRAELDVIVDATFLRSAERSAFRQLAAAAGARFAILDCEAPEPELRRRIEARAAQGRDASEATLAVLDRQVAEREPFDRSERSAAVRVATARPIDYRALLARLADR